MRKILCSRRSPRELKGNGNNLDGFRAIDARPPQNIIESGSFEYLRALAEQQQGLFHIFLSTFTEMRVLFRLPATTKRVNRVGKSQQQAKITRRKENTVGGGHHRVKANMKVTWRVKQCGHLKIHAHS